MHSGLCAALRLLMVMVAALLPAACGARPAPPTALSDVPSATAAAATPPAVATGAPTVPPQVRVAVGESMPGAPTAGARPWRVRVWPAEELATRLGAAAAGSVLLADAEGQVRAWTDGAAWWPGVGPAGFAWDADHRLWRRQETVWLPDVVLPGGWSGDEKTGFAGPLLEAEVVFLLKDPEGNYRVAVYYAQEKIEALGIEPENFLAERRAANPKENQVFVLPNGDVLYLSLPKTEKLAEGERIERRPNGDLVKIFPDGSFLYRITSWANVQSPADVRFVGGFEGPIDQQSLGLDPSLPPIPFAPPTMAPSDRQAKGYRYGFDLEKTKAILYDAKGQEIGRARYDQAQGKWVWEKVEPRYSFTSSSLTLEQAKNFLAGGEYLNPQQLQEQFAGRVFKEEKTGVTIVLSKAAQEQLLSAIPADELAQMEEKEREEKTGELIGESEWVRIFEKGIKTAAGKYWKGVPFTIWVNANEALALKEDPRFLEIGPPPVLFLWEKDQAIVIFLGDDAEAINNGSAGYLGWIENQKVIFKPIPLDYHGIRRGLGDTWDAAAYNNHYFSDRSGQIVNSDNYQIKSFLRIDDQGKPTWRPILPHERKGGEYEILTPEQRMKKAMADLKEVTGYDGEGLWEKRQNTLVDYTDTQGKKHHQELEVYFVHASQDPSSPVAYEILKDPKTGEMMYTIRASQDEKIKGLNETQASLVRQAWAYLLAADPQIMQKFWRVNRTMGISKGVFPQLSTNEIGHGLILFNENRIDDWGDVLSLLLETIVVESYELYGAQFGWGYPPQGKEGYPYTTLPPDCFNTDLVADAAQRAVRWYEKYGSSLPKNIKQLAESVTIAWAEGTKKWGNSCQPQIPFDP